MPAVSFEADAVDDPNSSVAKRLGSQGNARARQIPLSRAECSSSNASRTRANMPTNRLSFLDDAGDRSEAEMPAAMPVLSSFSSWGPSESPEAETLAAMPVLSSCNACPFQFFQFPFQFFQFSSGKCFGFPETFNVEGAGEGIASYDDEHYKTWPEPWTEIDEAEGWYLKSMTPLEELASFLATRGDCLTDNGRLGEAVQAYAWASAIAPEDKRYKQILCVRITGPGAARTRDVALDGNEPAKSRTPTANASGTTAGRPPSGIPSAMPVSAADRPPKLTFHEAMTRYNRELMEWNRLNQMGRARHAAERATAGYRL